MLSIHSLRPPPIWRLLTPQTFLRNFAAKPRKKRPFDPVIAEAITLEHFMLRQEVISLWRTILRGTRKIDGKDKRKETVRYAKGEIWIYRNIKDRKHIKYLILTGKTQWEHFQRYIDGL